MNSGNSILRWRLIHSIQVILFLMGSLLGYSGYIHSNRVLMMLTWTYGVLVLAVGLGGPSVRVFPLGVGYTQAKNVPGPIPERFRHPDKVMRIRPGPIPKRFR